MIPTLAGLLELILEHAGREDALLTDGVRDRRHHRTRRRRQVPLRGGRERHPGPHMRLSRDAHRSDRSDRPHQRHAGRQSAHGQHGVRLVTASELSTKRARLRGKKKNTDVLHRQGEALVEDEFGSRVGSPDRRGLGLCGLRGRSGNGSSGGGREGQNGRRYGPERHSRNRRRRSRRGRWFDRRGRRRRDRRGRRY